MTVDIPKEEHIRTLDIPRCVVTRSKVSKLELNQIRSHCPTTSKIIDLFLGSNGAVLFCNLILGKLKNDFFRNIS